MNTNQNINKLLYALKLKGQIYKINSFKFYSEKNDKYSIKYQIMKKIKEKIIDIETEEEKEIERFIKDKTCYSKVELLKYLIEEYKKGSEADGK